jgi:hypothetical protein
MVAATKNQTASTSDTEVNDYAHHLIAAVKGGALPEQELFHGYYYRVMPEKSGNAELVAYPADYRVSGVMTFIVAPDGTVYEKDLGPQTRTLAQQIQGKPSKDWVAVQPGSPESVAQGSQPK